MHLEERELVAVATLEGDTTVMRGEEPAAAEAQRIAPFKRDNIASFVDGFDDASHVSSRKLSLEHGPDRVAALNWILCHLMVHSITMKEVGQAARVDLHVMAGEQLLGAINPSPRRPAIASSIG